MTVHNKIRIGLLGLLLLAIGLGPGAAPSLYASGTSSYEPRQVVVKLAQQSGATIDEINVAYGTTTRDVMLYHNDIYLITPPTGTTSPQLVQLMSGDPRVVYAELNYIQDYPEEASTDRIYGSGGDDGSGVPTQNAAQTLELSAVHANANGAGAIVAVLDTGVQRNHPDLAAWINPLGYDFVDGDSAADDTANGLDDDGDGRVDEAYGHGTHVSGIVHLVAPEASLLPLRVLNSDGRGNNFRTAKAILYAAHNGADVINLSLGTTQRSSLLTDAVNEAARQGAVVVAAAGNLNSTSMQYPAAEACAVAVTAVDDHQKKSSFANYGTWIGVVAPGESIYSTIPVSIYAWWSGTSMATPFVAGQAALLRSEQPTLSLQSVGRLIGGTADSVDNKNPSYRGLLGYGQIDLVASLDALQTNTLPTTGVLASCAP